MCPNIIELEINPLVEQYLDTRQDGTNRKSRDWSLEDAQIKVDLITVQPGIATPIYDTILSSGLTVDFLSFNTTLNMIPGVASVGGSDQHAIRKVL